MAKDNIMRRVMRSDRIDLLQRDLAEAKRTREMPEPDDDRLDAIRERAIAYLESTDPEAWTPQMWGFFKEECKKLPSKVKRTSKYSEMSLADLKKSWNGKSSTSEP